MRTKRQERIRVSNVRVVNGRNGRRNPAQQKAIKRNWIIFRIRGIHRQLLLLWDEAAHIPETGIEELRQISNMLDCTTALCKYYDKLKQENLETRKFDKAIGV